jgi:hypothetical protein
MLTLLLHTHNRHIAKPARRQLACTSYWAKAIVDVVLRNDESVQAGS